MSAGILAPVAVVAVVLHRHGQGRGEGVALHLRQPRSLVDGNVGLFRVPDPIGAMLNR